LLKNLKKGDSVITQGGLYGKITALGDRVVGLEIAKNVIVQVSRGHIAGIAAPTEEQNP
jgi:preprotein translocase subunit YajC